jgi:hypothetical protein
LKTLDDAASLVSEHIAEAVDYSKPIELAINQTSLQYVNIVDLLKDTANSSMCIEVMSNLLNFYISPDTPICIKSRIVEMVRIAFAYGIMVGKEMER